VTLVNQSLPTGCGDRDPCGVTPARRASDEDSVLLRDLDGDREPEVLVDLYTGGAHCCTVSAIYTYREGSGRYRRVRHNWLDAGYRLRDLRDDDLLEFRTGDARFGYRFSSYAESYLPVRILGFRDARLVDVTRRHRRILRADARRALRLYRRVRDREVNVRGVLAAYAADRYRLGERRGARRALLRALRRGDLAPAYELDRGPFGHAYITRLDRFLRRIGYSVPRARVPE
jgi:hypothetical protein